MIFNSSLWRFLLHISRDGNLFWFYQCGVDLSFLHNSVLSCGERKDSGTIRKGDFVDHLHGAHSSVNFSCYNE